MYDIKDVISRMKYILSVDTNKDLAKSLNVSYNTLNTWIKRSRLPQDIILEFANRYNCSLDYLLLGKNIDNNLKNRDNTLFKDDMNIFKYYGNLENIEINNSNSYLLLELDVDILHSGGIYLLEKKGVFTVCRCYFNIFNNSVSIKCSIDIEATIDLIEFKEINRGAIVNISQY